MIETKVFHEVGRVVDANLNRLREGIRVIEDTLRYFHNDKSLALSLKNLRHTIKSQTAGNLLATRDVAHDVSKESIDDELVRENLYALVLANFKRAQESARVLEEYTKLVPQLGDTHSFKSVRYLLYELEKNYYEKYKDLQHHRWE